MTTVVAFLCCPGRGVQRAAGGAGAAGGQLAAAVARRRHAAAQRRAALLAHQPRLHALRLAHAPTHSLQRSLTHWRGHRQQNLYNTVLPFLSLSLLCSNTISFSFHWVFAYLVPYAVRTNFVCGVRSNILQ